MSKIVKGLLRFLIELAVITVLLVGGSTVINGMPLFGVPDVDDIQSVQISYPAADSGIETSSREDVELAQNLTSFLYYHHLFSPGRCPKDGGRQRHRCVVERESPPSQAPGAVCQNGGRGLFPTAPPGRVKPPVGTQTGIEKEQPCRFPAAGLPLCCHPPRSQYFRSRVRYCTASAAWAAAISWLLSRSAMVRATFSTRS